MNARATKLALGLLAVGAGIAAALVAVLIGNRRLDEWETLTPDDAGEGSFIELADGTRMHYLYRGGAGSPVILIHGLMDSAFHWHKNLDALAQHHRVWAVDLIGFGFSSRPREPNYSLKAYARHVHEFMDSQGIDRASLVGHSLGGAVALEFAHDYPERVDQLILIAPATFLLRFRPQVKLAARFSIISRALAGYTITSARARRAAWRSALGKGSNVDLEEMEIRLRPQRVKGTAEALLAMLGSPRRSDLPGELNQIAAPALILWGKDDTTVPLRHAGYHERDLPNVELVVLEGAGHIPQSECPLAVNRLMLDFLARSEQIKKL